MRLMISCQPLYKHEAYLPYDIESNIGRKILREILETGVSLFEYYEFTYSDPCSAFFERVCFEGKARAAMLCFETDTLTDRLRLNALASALCLGDIDVLKRVIGSAAISLTPDETSDFAEDKLPFEGGSIGNLDTFMFLKETRILDVFRLPFYQWRDLIRISQIPMTLPEETIDYFLDSSLQTDDQPRLTLDEIRQILHNLNIDINRYAASLQRWPSDPKAHHLYRMLQVGMDPAKLTETSLLKLGSYMAQQASRNSSLPQALTAFEQ